jgi:hypothetical protein
MYEWISSQLLVYTQRMRGQGKLTAMAELVVPKSMPTTVSW